MAETSIKISLELADKAAQKALSDFIDKGTKGESAFKKMGAGGNDAFTQIGISIGKASGLYDIFAGNLAANLATKAIESIASAASALFNIFVVDGVKAAIAQQDAVNSLNIALAQTGIYSESTSQSIQDFADELQNTTGVSDDVVIKNAALIQSLAQLDERGLKRATGAALDLSAALGRDFGTTSEALAKAANGNTTALQKMGFVFEKGRDNAETFENALKAVEDRFSGSAAAKVNTFSGALKLGTESFGDFVKELGNTVVQNPVFIQAMKEGAKIVQELTNVVKANAPAIAQFLGKAFIITADAVSIAITVFDAFVRIQTAGWRAIETYALAGAYAVAKALNLVGITSDETVATLKEQLNDKASSVFKSFSEDTGLGAAAQAVIRVGDAAEHGFAELQKGADGSVKPINNATTAVKALSEEQKAAQERLRSFALDLVKSGESSKSVADLQLQQAQTKADNDLAIEQQLLDNKIITQSEYLTRKAEIDAEYEAARVEIETEKYEQDQLRLDTALATKAISENEYIKSKEVLENKYLADKAKAEADYNKRKIKSDKETKDEEEKMRKYTLSSTASMFGGLADLAATGGKKMFEISKALNLAQAVTAGILSVQNAAASAPPPFNIPAIIASAAFAAANVIRISQTKAPSFAEGGIVPGNSLTGDRITANVNSREAVLTMQQQKRFMDIANGAPAGGGSRTDNLLAQLISAIQNQPISIMIDGKEVFGVIRSGLNAGRTFA